MYINALRSVGNCEKNHQTSGFLPSTVILKYMIAVKIFVDSPSITC